MNLEESIELLKSVRGNEYVATSDYESALGTVLSEIDRLKVELRNAGKVIEEYINKPSEASTDLWQRGYQEGFKQAKFDCEMDKLNEPKEITLREGLEFLQKECKGTDCKKCKNDLKTVCIDAFELSPANWDINNIIQAVEHLKRGE